MIAFENMDYFSIKNAPLFHKVIKDFNIILAVVSICYMYMYIKIDIKI